MSTIKGPGHSNSYVIPPTGKILVETKDDSKVMSTSSTISYNTPTIISAKRAIK